MKNQANTFSDKVQICVQIARAQVYVNKVVREHSSVSRRVKDIRVASTAKDLFEEKFISFSMYR